ncbi:MAG TPA: hypothetical protein VJQ57_09545 [Acidimicrobiia bacterium]|nr:hypothetical protein [Acidimicrobiia bacterium]
MATMQVQTPELRPGDVIVWPSGERDTVTAIFLPDNPTAIVARVNVSRDISSRVTPAHFYSGLQATHTVERDGWAQLTIAGVTTKPAPIIEGLHNPSSCNGESYPVNPSAPDEGSDIHHESAWCPFHGLTEVAS